MLAPKGFSFHSTFSRKRLTAVNIGLAITAIIIFGIAITQRWDLAATRHLSNTHTPLVVDTSAKPHVNTTADNNADADVHHEAATHTINNAHSATHAYEKPQQTHKAHLDSYTSYETCFDTIDRHALNKKVAAIQSECVNTPSPFQKYRARVMTLTAHFGSSGTAYQRGLERHLIHSLVHNAEFRALCKPIVDGMWNKQAHILRVLLEELSKPKDERMEWLYWADRDTVVLDYCRPWIQFTPPVRPKQEHDELDESKEKKEEKEIHLLAAEDHNGLNAGVFITRVNQWSVDFFSDVLAFRHFEPDVALPFEEQTAMAELMKWDLYKESVKMVPQHWFNSYMYEDPEQFITSNNTDGYNDNRVRRGDFLLHLAGTGNKEEVMSHCLNVTERLGNIWGTDKVQRDVTEETKTFWQ